MVALAALTFLVLPLIPYARFRAAWRGQVTAADYRYGESPNVPGDVSLPNRNLMNLLELPVLFYVGCLALRTAHSAIHLSYNKLFHRLTAFAASNVVPVAYWFRWVLALS